MRHIKIATYEFCRYIVRLPANLPGLKKAIVEKPRLKDSWESTGLDGRDFRSNSAECFSTTFALFPTKRMHSHGRNCAHCPDTSPGKVPPLLHIKIPLGLLNQTYARLAL